jgi:aryl-alcohol dehydrogenase-like predicted oxidoreductase
MTGVNLPPLKTRKLGRTNVSVTELGLGTAPLGELFDKVADAALSTASRVTNTSFRPKSAVS